MLALAAWDGLSVDRGGCVPRAALLFGITYSAWLFRQKDDPDDTEDEQLA